MTLGEYSPSWYNMTNEIDIVYNTETAREASQQMTTLCVSDWFPSCVTKSEITKHFVFQAFV